MKVQALANTISNEDFNILLKAKQALWEFDNQEAYFNIYEKYLNKHLGNEQGTELINRLCGVCRVESIMRINNLINARTEH